MIDLSYKDEHYLKSGNSLCARPSHTKIENYNPTERQLIGFVNSKLSKDFDFLQARKKHISSSMDYQKFKKGLELDSLEYVLIYNLKNKLWHNKEERRNFLKLYSMFMIYYDEKLIPYTLIKGGLFELLPRSYYLDPIYSYPNKKTDSVIAITECKTNIVKRKTEYLDDIMLFKISLGDKRFDAYNDLKQELEKKPIDLTVVEDKVKNI